MKPHLRALWLGCAVAVLASVGQAAPPAKKKPAYISLLQAHHYQQELERLKRQKEWMARPKADDIHARPDRFDGKVTEFSGRITGIVEFNGRTTLVVQEPDTPPIRVAIPDVYSVDDWDFLREGERVQLLCRVAVTEEDTGYLELWLPVAEAELTVLRARQSMASLRRIHRGNRPIPKYTMTQLVARHTQMICRLNRRIKPQEAGYIASTIIDCSRQSGLDSRLAMAVIAQESRFNTQAVSHAGAQGLGQLMPGTARDLGVTNPFDIRQNLSGSIRYLSRYVTKMGKKHSTFNAIKLALACYNAGEGNVNKHRGIPPFRETQDYVRKITRLYWLMLEDGERDVWKSRGWIP